MKIKIAFFDAKDYDRQSFISSNIDEEFEIKYYETRLTADTCIPPGTDPLLPMAYGI